MKKLAVFLSIVILLTAAPVLPMEISADEGVPLTDYRFLYIEDEVWEESSEDEVWEESSEDEVWEESSEDEVWEESSEDEVREESSEDEVWEESSEDEVREESSEDEKQPNVPTEDEVEPDAPEHFYTVLKIDKNGVGGVYCACGDFLYEIERVLPTMPDEYDLDEYFYSKTVSWTDMYSEDPICGTLMWRNLYYQYINHNEPISGEFYINTLIIDEDFFREFAMKYVLYDEDMLEYIYDGYTYDSEQGVYIWRDEGGTGGGTIYHNYVGFKQNGDFYEIYHAELDKLYVRYPTIEDYPETIEKDGRIYYFWEGGDCFYYAPKDNGIKYTVELKNGIMRFVSVSLYTADDLPDEFDKVVVKKPCEHRYSVAEVIQEGIANVSCAHCGEFSHQITAKPIRGLGSYDSYGEYDRYDMYFISKLDSIECYWGYEDMATLSYNLASRTLIAQYSQGSVTDIIVSEDYFEDFALKYVLSNPADIQILAQRCYNSETGKYTFHTYDFAYGCIFRLYDYMGYVKNGDIYEVFYYEWDMLPIDHDAYMTGDVLPEEIVIDGKVYRLLGGECEGFYYCRPKDSGVKYKVVLDDGMIKLVSAEAYTVDDLPDEFDKETVDNTSMGDINGNDEIDAVDYTLLKRAYFGIYNSEVAISDINGNEEIDAVDYTLLKRAYFGIYIIQ